MTNKEILKSIKTIDIKEGDTVVVEDTIFSKEMCREMTKLFKCKVVLIRDINKIGVLRFKNNK